jgi:hypothetical protein
MKMIDPPGKKRFFMIMLFFSYRHPQMGKKKTFLCALRACVVKQPQLKYVTVIENKSTK